MKSRIEATKGLSYRLLAERVKVFDHAQLWRIANAKQDVPDREGVIAIARAFNANIDEFLLAAGYAPENAPSAQPDPRSILEEWGIVLREAQARYDAETATSRKAAIQEEIDLIRLNMSSTEALQRKRERMAEVETPREQYFRRLAEGEQREDEQPPRRRRQRTRIPTRDGGFYEAPGAAAGEGVMQHERGRVEYDEVDAPHREE